MLKVNSCFHAIHWSKSEVITASISLALGIVAGSSCLAIGLTMGPNTLYFYVAAGAIGFNLNVFTAAILFHFCKKKHSNSHQIAPLPSIFDNSSLLTTNYPETKNSQDETGPQTDMMKKKSDDSTQLLKSDTDQSERDQKLPINIFDSMSRNIKYSESIGIKNEEPVSFDSNQFNLFSLPNEIIGEIFKFLNLNSLYKCSLVCKKFYQVFNEESLWKILLERDFGIERKSNEKHSGKMIYQLWDPYLKSSSTVTFKSSEKALINESLSFDDKNQAYGYKIESNFKLFRKTIYIATHYSYDKSFQIEHATDLNLENHEQIIFPISSGFIIYSDETKKFWLYLLNGQKIEIKNNATDIDVYSFKYSNFFGSYFLTNSFLICRFREKFVHINIDPSDPTIEEIKLPDNFTCINWFNVKCKESYLFYFLGIETITDENKKIQNKLVEYRYQLNKKEWIKNEWYRFFPLKVKIDRYCYQILTENKVFLRNILHNGQWKELKVKNISKIEKINDFIVYQSNVFIICSQEVFLYNEKEEKKIFSSNGIIANSFIQEQKLILYTSYGLIHTISLEKT